MKMTAEKKAIDKVFRRRDRYDIPDWQRQEVWGREKKQRLIDSMLRGWKLPKFYFVKVSGDNYLVEDGQQRLAAIWEFFSNDLPLSVESAKEFGGRLYRDLPRRVADSLDDFEIEYDLIEEASDKELKDFFQRPQEGMTLTSSEKLNAIHSKLLDYCASTSKHPFFKKTVAFPNTRYAHFDVLAKVATVEIEGTDAALRFDDIKEVFEAQTGFAPTSAIAKRIKAALDFLHTAFKNKGSSLRTRTIVQSLITLTCKLVETGRSWFSTVFGTILCPRLFPDFLPEVAPALGARQSTPTIPCVVVDACRQWPWPGHCYRTGDEPQFSLLRLRFTGS
jgi:hypothetical protein